MDKMLSVIVSVYNEEDALPAFYETLKGVLDSSVGINREIIFVNDGSTDKSAKILSGFAEKNADVKILELARNFGHEAAMIAGIDYAKGDYIICMDADLQHPPAKIPEILKKFDEGYDVVSMVRTKNSGSGILSRLSSALFYRILNLFSPTKLENNSSDFFAVSRPVADILRHDYREKVRYLRGYVQSVGFDRATIDFEAGKRVAGKSKYSFRNLARFSIHTLCSFSDVPLKLGIYSGVFVAILGIILIIYSLIQKIFFDTPAGYTTIIIALCFLFAVVLFVIGIIGEYISIIFAEVKDRPVYIVKSTENIK